VVARQPPRKKKQTKVVGAVEDFAEGWHPHSSVKYKPLADADVMSEAVSSTEDGDDAGGEEVDAAAASAVSEQECINWTPTGTGGYPEDWAALSESTWTPGDLRVGAIGIKLGMTHSWDSWGKRIPLTAIHLKDNVITEERSVEEHGVSATVVGAVNHSRPHKLRNSYRNQYESKGMAPRRHSTQFKVSPTGQLPMGTAVNVDHFVPGQYVDVIGKTVGKGHAGVMKRHNMAGGNASHGTTKSHRKMGASGGGQDPGRIWPGKRMAGHMGDKKTIHHSLQLYKIDTRWNVMYVKGNVPGKPGAVVKISDARRKPHVKAPPYPTATPGAVPAGIHTADPTVLDPGLAMTD
jgi:large subunit ribosomal protein L3